MAGEMLALGDYRFSVDTGAYQDFKRKSAYKWPGQDRIRNWQAHQYVGRGTETINLAGVIYPFYMGGLGQLDAMRGEAAKARPLRLVDGRGNNLGRWAISSVDETQATFFEDGAPRKVNFSLSLVYFGEDEAWH